MSALLVLLITAGIGLGIGTGIGMATSPDKCWACVARVAVLTAVFSVLLQAALLMVLR